MAVCWKYVNLVEMFLRKDLLSSPPLPKYFHLIYSFGQNLLRSLYLCISSKRNVGKQLQYSSF